MIHSARVKEGRTWGRREGWGMGEGNVMHDSVPITVQSDHESSSLNLESAAEPDPEPDSRAEVLDPSRLLSASALLWLSTHTQAALAFLNAAGEVRARIVNDTEMAAAHLKYSGIPGTTDVLTFDLRDPCDHPTTQPLDVDLWICADEARRHAAAHGHTVERELVLYILHGILHCRGFDDHTEAEHALMHAEEDRVLAAIGVGATFSAPRTDASGIAPEVAG